MTRQQFSTDDEATGHAAMLHRIRTEQLATKPEPDHEASYIEDWIMCEPNPIRHWCCDWHEAHA